MAPRDHARRFENLVTAMSLREAFGDLGAISMRWSIRFSRYRAVGSKISEVTSRRGRTLSPDCSSAARQSAYIFPHPPLVATIGCLPIPDLTRTVGIE